MHIRLCARWGIGVDELAATPEEAATVAYTRFVLDCGAAGDLLDLHVALAPCVVGYAVIGEALAPDGVAALADHPYREWIGEYAGQPYRAVAARAAPSRRPRGAVPDGGRWPDLVATFAAARGWRPTSGRWAWIEAYPREAGEGNPAGMPYMRPVG